MRPAYIVGILIVVAVIIGVVRWQSGSEEPVAEEAVPEVAAPEVTAPPSGAATTAPQVPAPTPMIEPAEPTTVEPPPVTLPELPASDEFVLTQIEPWSLPETWLQRDDLLSRATVVLLNTASGKVPSRQVSFLVPGDAYPVEKVGEQYFVDPAGFQRYDTYLDTLTAIEPAELAEFLRLVDPLLVQALAQLGERRSPRSLVEDTIARIEGLQPLAAAPRSTELLRESVLYTYADPKLEALPDLDKQLLRIGPENLSRLKSYLSDLKEVYILD